MGTPIFFVKRASNSQDTVDYIVQRAARKNSSGFPGLIGVAKLSVELANCISQAGIDLNDVEEGIVQKLRQLIVSEWLSNPERYQPFLVDSTVFDEAPAFLQSGQFNLELGNTMPLAMTHVLGIPIIIISSLENHGIIRVDPETPITSLPLVLAFNQYGAGHYDGVKDISREDAVKPVKCRCGINKKSKSPVSCVSVVGQYSSRCKCFNSRKQCSSACGCVNCDNPHGKKPQPATIAIGKKRVRQHHELTQPQQVKKFLEGRGEEVTMGSWTMLEYMIFALVIQFYFDEDLQVCTQNIHLSFNRVIDTANSCQDLQLPVGHKTVRQIAARYSRYRDVLSVFRTLFCQQVSLNVTTLDD